MLRFLLIGLALIGVCAGAAAFWLSADTGALIELSDDQVEAARESGQGARDIVVDATGGEAPLPTLEELKFVAERSEIDAIAQRVAAERDASSGDERALLTVLLSEVERLRGNGDACFTLAKEGAESLPQNSRARHAYAKALLGQMMREAEANGGGMKAMLGALDDVKAYQAEVSAAIELDPSNVDARVAQIITLAYAPWPIGNKKRAKKEIEAIGEYDELRRDFWRAQLLVADKSKLDEAIAAYVALDRQYPDDLDIRFTLGDLYVKNEAWADALGFFDPLIEEGATPHGYRAMYQSAKVRELAGIELPRALELLKALEAANPVGDLMPTPRRVKYRIGAVLLKLDRLDEARVALLESKALGGPRKDVDEALKVVAERLNARGTTAGAPAGDAGQ